MRETKRQELWPVTYAAFSSYGVFTFPDRLSDGTNFTEDNYSMFPTLEELGIENWDLQLAQTLLPTDRPLAVWASTASWKLMGISRFGKCGRSLWVKGVRWHNCFGTGVFTTIPLEALSSGEKVLSSLGYDDEWHPEFILTPNGAINTWDEQYLISWCKTPELWRDPGLLIPERATSVVAFFNGWLYFATEIISVPLIRQKLKDLVNRWDISMVETVQKYAWINYKD